MTRPGTEILAHDALGGTVPLRLWGTLGIVFAILACESEPVDPRL